MSNPWNEVSLAKEEPKLLEIVSEELCNRLHIDNNFVWIDIREAQQVKNATKPAELECELEFITKEKSSSAASVADIAQFMEKGEGTVTEQAYHEEDYEWDDRQPSHYFEELTNVRVKSIDFPKLRYPRPQRSKHIEHGTNRNHRSDKTKDIGERNKLLPKISFDASTTAVLEKFITNRYLGQYNDVIGRGKNSIVFHAYCHRNNCMSMTYENAVKVYKIGSNKESNKLVFKGVQREFYYLNILNEHKKIFRGPYDYPMPIRASRNVIVMAFSGFNQIVSQSIQDLPLVRDHGAYHEVIDLIDRCYNIMHLVHGKLSPKKILYRYDLPFFLGWSHAVKSDHPQALSKLIRDCKFVTEFYAKRGVMVKSTEDLFKEITKVNKISKKLLEIIKEKDLYEKYDTNPNRSPSPTKPNNNGNLRFK